MKAFTSVKSCLTQTYDQFRRQLIPIVWGQTLRQVYYPIDNRVRPIIYGPHWSIDFSTRTAILTQDTQCSIKQGDKTR
jgi:hypothetical protein